MLRSMYSGISGLRNFQTKLDVIGNNIANVNTYGFKKGRTIFKDLISQTVAGASAPGDARGGVNPKQVGLGSQIAAIDTLHTGGSTQFTGNTLDLAVAGDGFFQVMQGNETMYTRAGNFYMDSSGDLVDGDGRYVQGELGKITIPTTASSMSVGQDGTVYFVDLPPGGAAAIAKAETDFKPAQDKFVPLEKALKEAEEKLKIAKADLKIAEVALKKAEALDPALPGTAATLLAAQQAKTTADGDVTTKGGEVNTAQTAYDTAKPDYDTAKAKFDKVMSDNKATLQEAGQIQMAKFSNPGGLEKTGGNLFRESANSGEVLTGFALEQGFGTMESGFLEMSNVDLAEEFTEMIVAQRGFQANTRIITTSDEILQELVNLKR
ncbi:MAG TPA: flagellar hook-basal body complex protein [Sporosarcina psychrophila]|uniref:Flagellar hook protein FlgE n=1 Tax=Sporosarcina psychrophila TaxID=1476 RepID=A0A921FZL7_SPOPS|nr:flagellar hook-basal body complex protein [Sporosarcina psychrophila]